MPVLVNGTISCAVKTRSVICAYKRKKESDNPREGWEDGTPPPHRDFKERSVVLALAYPNPWSSASFYLPSQTQWEKAKRKKEKLTGIGEEDRVPTCTSRILEGRSGGQREGSRDIPFLLAQSACGALSAHAGAGARDEERR